MSATSTTLTIVCPHCGHEVVLGAASITTHWTHLTCSACGRASLADQAALLHHEAWRFKSIRRGRSQVDVPHPPPKEAP